MLRCLVFIALVGIQGISCSKKEQPAPESANYFFDLVIEGKRFYSGIAKDNPGLTPANVIRGTADGSGLITVSTRYCDPPNSYCFNLELKLEDYSEGTYIPDQFDLFMQQGSVITSFHSKRYGAGVGSVKMVIDQYKRGTSGKPGTISGVITGVILRKASSTLYYSEKLHGRFLIPIYKQ